MKKISDTPPNDSGMNIPDYAFKALAKCLLPKIQAYYESDEGKQALAQWERQHEIEESME